jgi:hypothetical protein
MFAGDIVYRLTTAGTPMTKVEKALLIFVVVGLIAYVLIYRQDMGPLCEPHCSFIFFGRQ